MDDTISWELSLKLLYSVVSTLITNGCGDDWKRHGAHCCSMPPRSLLHFLLLCSQTVWGNVIFFYLFGWKCASQGKTHKKNSTQAFLLVEFSRTLDHSSVYIRTEESEGNKEKLVIILHIPLKYFLKNKLNAYNLWKLCIFIKNCEAFTWEYRM